MIDWLNVQQDERLMEESENLSDKEYKALLVRICGRNKLPNFVLYFQILLGFFDIYQVWIQFFGYFLGQNGREICSK
jgi:hypothetical protein